jgi:predicted nuclease with TOPRIM domain
MSTLDSFKDPRSVASVTALVGLGISWAYFQSEISALKEEQEELRKHLQTIIKTHPNTNEQLENLRHAVKILDTRLNKQHEEMRMMTEKSIPPITSSHQYQRLTERTPSARPQHITHNSIYEDEDEQSDFDLANEIAAMS